MGLFNGQKCGGDAYWGLVLKWQNVWPKMHSCLIFKVPFAILKAANKIVIDYEADIYKTCLLLVCLGALDAAQDLLNTCERSS